MNIKIQILCAVMQCNRGNLQDVKQSMDTLKLNKLKLRHRLRMEVVSREFHFHEDMSS
jgi:hypothetical protein